MVSSDVVDRNLYRTGKTFISVKLRIQSLFCKIASRKGKVEFRLTSIDIVDDSLETTLSTRTDVDVCIPGELKKSIHSDYSEIKVLIKQNIGK